MKRSARLKIDAAVRAVFNRSGQETKMFKHDNATKPGARSATYDPPNRGTRKRGDRQGKVGTDDLRFNREDSEGRHGDLLKGGRFYSSHPQIVDEAQDRHDEIIDKHAAKARQVAFSRADVLANENAYESAFPGDRVGGESNPVEGPAWGKSGASRQAKRGDKKA